MVQRLSGQQVKVITKDGECHITLDININIEDIKVALEGFQAGALGQKAKIEEEEKDDFKWEIPDFGSGEIIDFGKNDDA